MKRTSLLLAMVLGLFVLLTVTAGISYAMSQADEDLIRKIDGRRYSYSVRAQDGTLITRALDIRGNTFVYTLMVGVKNYEPTIFEIRGRETRHQWPAIEGGSDARYSIFTISDDGEIITQRTYYGDGSTHEDVYFWRR